MKKYILSFLLLTVITTVSFSQEYVSGTINHGSVLNSVMLAIKSNTTFTSQFSNVQFLVQIPNTVTPQPTATILSNPLSTYINSTYATQVTDEGGFYNYLFSTVVVGATPFTFTSNTEYNALEIKFENGPTDILSDVRFGHLPDGGSTSQLAFYIEMGNDFTNYSNMFYGEGSSNGGSYSSYSYVPLSNVSLPNSITNFSVAKKNDNALLNWTLDNQVFTNGTFDIERSIDGLSFVKIGTVNITNSSAYQFVDQNISAVKKSGLIYYRLKQSDLISRYSYTEIKSIKMDASVNVSVYPNPTAQKLTLQFESISNQPTKVTITDLNGKIVKTLNHNSIEGVNTLSLNLQSLSRGVYNIVVSQSGNNKQAQFIKQ
jgi:hypothetical protein